MRLRGALACLLMVLPPTLACLWLLAQFDHWLLEAAILYFCLDLRDLRRRGRAVADTLLRDDLPAARQATAELTPRQTRALDAAHCAREALEALLELACKQVFGALFWFVIAGAPGALLYRLIAELDLLWGYRSLRHLHFGWFAARSDDWLSWPVARLTALSYALSGDTPRALFCWRSQRRSWDCGNNGPLMSAGAGALGLSIAGAALHHDSWQARPALGHGREPDADDIESAVELIERASWLWLAFSGIALLAMA
jgi:adenosylcobinamide-phosphate synthase